MAGPLSENKISGSGFFIRIKVHEIALPFPGLDSPFTRRHKIFYITWQPTITQGVHTKSGIESTGSCNEEEFFL